MISDLGELISRYEAAQDRVVQLVEAGPESEGDLLSADKALSTAFNDIISLKLSDPQQSVRRVRFLLDLIKSNQPDNELVGKLADQIWRDVVDCEFATTENREDLMSKIAQGK